MKWLTKNNKLAWHPDNKYRINWVKKAPSKGAQAVKDFLKEYCSGSIWYEEYRLPGMLLRVDFLSPNKKVAIEFNGIQHEKFVKFFYTHRVNYQMSFKRDLKKEEFLTKNGYTFIEIYERDLPLTREFFKEKYNIII
jgi:hypothetical protein